MEHIIFGEDYKNKTVNVRLDDWFVGQTTQPGDDTESNTNDGVLGCFCTFCRRFVLGSIAGDISASAVYPVDLVKTVM